MADITVRQVDQGFNAQVRDAVDLKRGAAADGSQNVLYSRGIIKTPYGFDKVESGSLPLDSGKPVLGLGVYSELDKTQHFLAVTNDTIQERDIQNAKWTDRTQSGAAFGANMFNPISFATILHTDGLALNGTGDLWYHHGLVCNGGVTCIQRWAGKYETDFADLAGADGYHHASSTYTTHFARQVISFYNHVLLISPKIADANDDLKENNQKVQWSQIGKLEVWTGTTSGHKLLVDTGGWNMWAALMGSQLMIYQNNSVYSLNHIGGNDVFDLRVEMPDLGLLAPHLLLSKGNVHYLVGNDYNLYAYFGGSNKEIISNNIQRFFERDLDPAYQNRCWLQIGAQNSRLWLFIVPNGQTYVTQAYAVDMKSGAWMKRDFTHKWTTSSSGITCVGLVGAGSYEAGMSYAELVATGKTYADLVTEGTTYQQLVQTTLTEERMALGDNTGNVYQYFSDAVQDDSVSIPSQHITDIEDFGTPGKNKLWPGITITAKGSGVNVSYRTDNFETTDTGWTNLVSTWLGITSSNLVSHCGDTFASHTLAQALDGTDYWSHLVAETHYFIVDLGQNYNVTKVRGRSNRDFFDPTVVNIYVSEDGSTWGTAVASNITTWQDTTSWVEVNTTEKVGRYVKVEITATEGGTGAIRFGGMSTPMSIFDVCVGDYLTSEFKDYFYPINDTSKKIQFKFHSNALDWQVSNYVLKEPQLQGEI